MQRQRWVAPVALTAALLAALAGAWAAKNRMHPSGSAVDAIAGIDPNIPAKPIEWTTGYASALKRAKAENRLILVDFYTDWCGYCKKLDAEVYPTPQVQRVVNASFIPVRLNAEKEKDGIEQSVHFNVTGFPCILILDDAGNELYRIGGYMAAEPFTKSLVSMVAAARATPELLARVKANPNDVDALGDLTEIYVGQHHPDKAQDILTRLTKVDPDNRSGKVSKATLQMGEMYLQDQDAEKAAPLLQRAAKIGKNGMEVGYAHISLALCAAIRNDKPAAISELQAVQATPDVPKELSDKAAQMLQRIQHAPS